MELKDFPGKYAKSQLALAKGFEKFLAQAENGIRAQKKVTQDEHVRKLVKLINDVTELREDALSVKTLDDTQMTLARFEELHARCTDAKDKVTVGYVVKFLRRKRDQQEVRVPNQNGGMGGGEQQQQQQEQSTAGKTKRQAGGGLKANVKKLEEEKQELERALEMSKEEHQKTEAGRRKELEWKEKHKQRKEHYKEKYNKEKEKVRRLEEEIGRLEEEKDAAVASALQAHAAKQQQTTDILLESHRRMGNENETLKGEKAALQSHLEALRQQHEQLKALYHQQQQQQQQVLPSHKRPRSSVAPPPYNDDPSSALMAAAGAGSSNVSEDNTGSSFSISHLPRPQPQQHMRPLMEGSREEAGKSRGRDDHDRRRRSSSRDRRDRRSRSRNRRSHDERPGHREQGRSRSRESGGGDVTRDRRYQRQDSKASHRESTHSRAASMARVSVAEGPTSTV